MTKQRNRPRVGDENWEVQWCSRLAFYPDSNDVDHDRCTMSIRHFPTRDEALAFAVKTWPATQETFGIVQFYPIRFVPYDEADAEAYPHVGHWEVMGSEYDSRIETISDDSGVPE